jgi:hypothetical protein
LIDELQITNFVACTNTYELIQHTQPRRED